ncbi:MAG: hypothetical protein MJ189_02930 [Coriobacteriales bacterium]|nr:hypothetical protein [Coriobacteriales bacterium]
MKKIATAITLILLLTLGAVLVSGCTLTPKDIDKVTSELASADNQNAEKSTSADKDKNSSGIDKLGSQEQNIEKGFYFKGKDGKPDFSKRIVSGTIVPKNSELALFDANKNYVRFKVQDGSSFMRLQFGKWYGAGNTEYVVDYIRPTPDEWECIYLYRR